MATQTNRITSTHCNGTFTADTLVLSDGSVTNAKVAAGSNVSADKLQHRHVLTLELFGPAVTVTALTKHFFIANAPGDVVAVKAYVVTKATGADRDVVVDVKKSTVGGALATIMTGTITLDDGSTDLTPVAGTVNASSGALIENDLLAIVVTVAGSAGNQALGLTVNVVIDEDAD